MIDFSWRAVLVCRLGICCVYFVPFHCLPLYCIGGTKLVCVYVFAVCLSKFKLSLTDFTRVCLLPALPYRSRSFASFPFFHFSESDFKLNPELLMMNYCKLTVRSLSLSLSVRAEDWLPTFHFALALIQLHPLPVLVWADWAQLIR